MPILTAEDRLATLFAGRYRLESILGKGGMGVVFEGVHSWTGRRVALKLLKPQHTEDLNLVRRFLQEARSAAGISHPHVVQVLDMGSDDDGTVYLVMELLEGTSLGRRLEEESPLPVAECLSLLVPIMDALDAAHGAGVIHRDLKPDNVFLHRDAQGRLVPKLLDFGMSKMLDAEWGRATQTGTLVGTPFYMSPEQAEGRPDQGPASDVWSMGVMLYRCLSSALPFHAETPTALLLSIVRDRPKPLGELEPSVPAAIAGVIDRALVADLEQRIPDMRALLDALRAAALQDGVPWPTEVRPETAEPVEPFDPGPPAPAPRPVGAWLWAGAAAAALVIAIAIGVAALSESAASPSEEAPRDSTATARTPSGESAGATQPTPPIAPTDDRGSPEPPALPTGAGGTEPPELGSPGDREISGGADPPSAGMAIPDVTRQW